MLKSASNPLIQGDTVTLNRDIITGAVVLCFGIVLFCLTFTINEMTISGIGAESMPRLVAIAFGMSGIILISTGIRAKVLPAPEASSKKNDKAANGHLLVGLNILLFLVYLYALEDIGFLLTTPVYLFLQMVLLSGPGETRPGLFALVSIITALGSYYLFLKAFQIILPAGILG